MLSPGLCTLLVDHGRPRTRSLGVPVGGAADRFSLALGNALVGNPPDAPALEVCLSGPVLRADEDLACVLFGAPFELSAGWRRLTAGKPFTLHPGEELSIHGTAERARAYLCVAGGLDGPEVLGSRSSLQPLVAGDEFPCRSGTIAPRFLHASFECAAEPYLLRFLPGAQASWFANDRSSSSLSVSTTARPQDPVPSTIGPKTTICPESRYGCQCAAWRPMISRSSSLMSSANVGRGARSRNTKVLMSQ